MVRPMISSISLPALSSTPPIRDARANERLAPATTGRVTSAPPVSGAAQPSASSPRGSLLNLSV